MIARRWLVLGVVGALLATLAGLLFLLDSSPGPTHPSPRTLAAAAGGASQEAAVPPPAATGEVGRLEVQGTSTLEGGSLAPIDDAVGAELLPQVAFTGRVVETTGEPVGGARVLHLPARRTWVTRGLPPLDELTSIAWDELASTLTDADGRFRLLTREQPVDTDEDYDPRTRSAWPYRQPQLVARHPDFAARAWPCASYEAGDHDAGDIVLRAAAGLRGRVVDEDGRPLEGAEIVQSASSKPFGTRDYGPWHPVRSAQAGVSGSDGHFLVREAWPGEVTFDVSLPGFVPTSFHARLEADEVHPVGDVVLTRGAVIGGHVVDADGLPVPGAEVLARAAEARYGLHDGDTVLVEWRLRWRTQRSSGELLAEVRTTTDASGAFAFHELNAERYAIFAGAPGREPAVHRDVALGERHVRLVLESQASLLVTVVDATTGERVRGIAGKALRLMGEGTDAHGLEPLLDVLAEDEVPEGPGTEGDTDGLLRVQGAGPGGTHLFVSAEGYATTGFALPGVEAPHSAAHVVRLPTESTLAGRVLDARGLPLADARVTLEPLAEKDVKLLGRQTRTDGEGRYLIRGLSAGDWTLCATATGHVPSEPHPVSIEVAAELAGEDVQLELGAAIHGVVRAADGTPAIDASVSARWFGAPQQEPSLSMFDTVRDDRAPFTSRTDVEGRFAFDGLPAGSYALTSPPAAKQDVLASAGEVAEVALVLRRHPVLTGRVTDADGPVAGAEVLRLLKHRFLSEPGPAITNALGFYELEIEHSGRIQIVARHAGESTAATDVTVDWNTSHVLDLTFSTGRANGRVTERANGEAIEGAQVTLTLVRPRADGSFTDVVPRLEFAPVATDADGRFALRRLVPGPYRVEALANGYVTAQQVPVEVPATGAPVELTLRLERGATITGRVLTPDGSPPPSDLRIHISDAAGIRATATVAPDGRYELTGLPNGSFVMRVEPLVLLGMPSTLAEQTVTVTDAQPIIQDLVLAPP